MHMAQNFTLFLHIIIFLCMFQYDYQL
uniref:Uncharacterized protein n=1 Tax=Rhizophora mucronata TaxID=61149 RepID=A0A2P2PSC3_RHIMU